MISDFPTGVRSRETHSRETEIPVSGPTLLDVYETLRAGAADARPGTRFHASVPPGTPVSALVDMADALRCRLRLSPGPDDHALRICFERMGEEDGFHGQRDDDPEKYGAASAFAVRGRLNDPGFFTGFLAALSLVPPGPGARILDLGINTGDEFALIERFCGRGTDDMTMTGIDRSESALAVAKERFPGPRFSFIAHDINRLHEIDIGTFDLLISVATLHSPGIDSRRVFMDIMQTKLAPGAAVIIGFPNCRYVDGEPLYGARTRNRREPDLSLVVKDIHFVKKYLQQHRFRVVVTGKNYLFVVGIPSPGLSLAEPVSDGTYLS
jgi:SAM-dependent methyltransferase